MNNNGKRRTLSSSARGIIGKDDFEKQLSSELATPLWPLDLHTSSSLGLLSAVEATLKRNPHLVNCKNRGSFTPLMYAAYYGHDSVAAYLIKFGSDINSSNDKGQTALMMAAMCSHLTFVEMLLKNDVFVDAVDKNGMNALFHAARTGSDSVVQLLLSVGSNPNCVTFVDGLSPLLLLAAEGRESLFLTLLKKGADINQKMRNGHTARSLAAAGHHNRIVTIIDGHMSRMNSVFSLFGGTHSTSRITNASAISTISQFNPPVIKASNPLPKDLATVLESIGLKNYYPIFEEQDIDLSVFVTMNDDDLREIGIKLYGHIVKLRNAIESLRNVSTSTMKPSHAHII